jgi:hypothetical protein
MQFASGGSLEANARILVNSSSASPATGGETVHRDEKGRMWLDAAEAAEYRHLLGPSPAPSRASGSTTMLRRRNSDASSSNNTYTLLDPSYKPLSPIDALALAHSSPPPALVRVSSPSSPPSAWALSPAPRGKRTRTAGNGNRARAGTTGTARRPIPTSFVNLRGEDAKREFLDASFVPVSVQVGIAI